MYIFNNVEYGGDTQDVTISVNNATLATDILILVCIRRPSHQTYLLITPQTFQGWYVLRRATVHGDC